MPPTKIKERRNPQIILKRNIAFLSSFLIIYLSFFLSFLFLSVFLSVSLYFCLPFLLFVSLCYFSSLLRGEERRRRRGG